MLSAAPTATGFVGDRRLPHRDQLLDEEVMRGVFGRALRLEIDSTTRLRTKYRVGESLRASYRLTAGSNITWMSVRAVAHGHDPRALSGVQPDVHLPGVNAVGWIFPRDRRLTSLPLFWTDNDARNRVVPAGIDAMETVSYAPEKAATIRCRAGADTVGYAKLYAGDRHLAAAEVHRALGPALRSAGVSAPQALTCDDDLGLVVISPMAGDALSTAPATDDWRRLGEATARLHAVPPPAVLPPFRRATLGRLRSVGALIASARPDVGHQLTVLLARLARSAPRPADAAGAEVTLHGDLHPKNVLVDGDRLGFVDLDQAARGPAAAELGSVIAALRHEELCTATTMGGFEEQFLDGYGLHAALPPREILAWYVAAALLGERALRAVNRVRVDGLARLPLVIASATDALNEVER